jgi:hypothetical protein
LMIISVSTRCLFLLPWGGGQVLIDLSPYE